MKELKRTTDMTNPYAGASIGGRIKNARARGDEEALRAALADKERLKVLRAKERAEAVLASIEAGDYEDVIR